MIFPQLHKSGYDLTRKVKLVKIALFPANPVYQISSPTLLRALIAMRKTFGKKLF
jgi:hypothetical protein